MASPETAERESVPEGIFIRYATVHDVDAIKDHLARQDSQMDRQDVKTDLIVADVTEIKARQKAQGARLDAMSADMSEMKGRTDSTDARMDRLETKMDKLNAHMYRLLYVMIATAVGVVLLFAREIFF